MFDAPALASAIASCLPHGGCELHKPALGDAEASAAADCIRYGIDNYEPVDAAEKLLAETCRVRHSIAVSSGTMALQIALMTLGVERGDVVLVPSLSFAAAAAAVYHVGAEPFFLDSQDYDLGLSPFKLRRFLERECANIGGLKTVLKRNGKRVAALIAAHLFGLPCRIREIDGLAREWNVPPIEDACEALGSRDMGRPCGSFGAIAVTSFNTNKIVTAGGGGAIMTEDDGLAERARHLAATARLKHAWLVEHDGIGQNARIPTLCAAVLVPQLERLGAIIAAKQKLATAYRAAAEAHGATLVQEREACVSNYWLPTLLLDPRWQDGRDAVLSALHRHDIHARAAFTPLHRLKPYEGFGHDDMAGSEDIWRRAICLPSSAMGMG